MFYSLHNTIILFQSLEDSEQKVARACAAGKRSSNDKPRWRKLRANSIFALFPSTPCRTIWKGVRASQSSFRFSGMRWFRLVCRKINAKPIWSFDSPLVPSTIWEENLLWSLLNWKMTSFGPPCLLLFCSVFILLVDVARPFSPTCFIRWFFFRCVCSETFSHSRSVGWRSDVLNQVTFRTDSARPFETIKTIWRGKNPMYYGELMRSKVIQNKSWS